MTEKDARATARGIARALFTNVHGQHADRLVLRIDSAPERDLGGWCERAVSDRIATALMRLTDGAAVGWGDKREKSS